MSCNRETLLALPLAAYKRYADTVESGFREAASFLHEQKVISKHDVPYAPLLVGLAASYAILGRAGRTVSAEDKAKIERWFWCVTLGEVYGSATDTLLARHVPEIVKWIIGNGPAPDVLGDVTFQQERLRSLRSRLSAAYKAIHVLLMGYDFGCKDFITGKTTGVMTFFSDRIDVHHIFPVAWCKHPNRVIPANVYNSIVNKTPLSAATNRFIGGDPPSVYLKRIEEKFNMSSEAVDVILRTHLIEPEHLRKDDFEEFYDSRIEALSEIVSQAMGRPVVREQGTNEVEWEVEEPEEDDEDVSEVALIDMIREGESAVVEFKSTLRTNLHTNKTDKRMEYTVLKTLAGFLNANGGTLVIGVADDGKPVGIEADNFSSPDKMSLHLTNIVNSQLGPNAMTLIHTSFDDFEDCRVLVVNCQRSQTVVYVKDDNVQRFYVRTGPSTTELTGRDMVEYINQRFGR